MVWNVWDALTVILTACEIVTAKSRKINEPIDTLFKTLIRPLLDYNAFSTAIPIPGSSYQGR